MANRKISELSAAGALTGTELVEIVQSGSNVQTTTQDIADLGGGGGGSSNDKADALITIVSDSGAYTLQASDLALINTGTTLIIEGDASGDLTVPDNGTVAFPIGTVIGLRYFDNVVQGGSSSISPTSGTLEIASGMTASLEKTGTNTWILHNGTSGGGGGGGGTWGTITGTLSDQTDLNTALGLKAPLASPTFTGTPAAPTASAATNTTQIATTAFVQSNSIAYTPADELTTIAGVSLEANITAAQLLSALAIPVVVAVHADALTPVTLTNMASAAAVFPLGGSSHYLKLNTTNLSYIRLSARVSTTSASVNNPRMYIMYSINSGSSYTTLGAGTIASGDAISLFTGVGAVQVSNWITLPSDAKGDSIQFRVMTEGGDGAADPVIGNVYIEFKT
jgi:hypothetical protein